NAPARALRRVISAVVRPFRVAILGEANSGKSSLANLIAGEPTLLPASPLPNTRLPTLLRYAPAPCVEAFYETGRRTPLLPRGPMSFEGVLRLEVGLPNSSLRRVEVLDCPGSANPLFRAEAAASVLPQRVDMVLWVTVATQAWRETERVSWQSLPYRLRRRG